MRMVIGEQSLESRVNGVDVRVLRLLEVDIRQYPPEHGRKRDRPFDFASAHLRFARDASEHFVFDRDRFEFRTAQPEI